MITNYKKTKEDVLKAYAAFLPRLDYDGQPIPMQHGGQLVDKGLARGCGCIDEYAFTVPKGFNGFDLFIT